MNRRGFIATITALAGIALAKIKTPAAPNDYLAVTATGTFKPDYKNTLLKFQNNGKTLFVFKNNAIYVLDKDGYRRLHIKAPLRVDNT